MDGMWMSGLRVGGEKNKRTHSKYRDDMNKGTEPREQDASKGLWVCLLKKL